MCDMMDFNSKCFASVRRAIGENTKRAMLVFGISHEQAAEILKLSQKSVETLSNTPLFAVEPNITPDCFYNHQTPSQEQDVTELNFSYLMAVRHIASTNVRRAAMKSRISIESCEIIRFLSLAQVQKVAAANSLLFRFSISDRAMAKANAAVQRGTSTPFLAHVSMLSFALGA